MVKCCLLIRFRIGFFRINFFQIGFFRIIFFVPPSSESASFFSAFSIVFSIAFPIVFSIAFSITYSIAFSIVFSITFPIVFSIAFPIVFPIVFPIAFPVYFFFICFVFLPLLPVNTSITSSTKPISKSNKQSVISHSYVNEFLTLYQLQDILSSLKESPCTSPEFNETHGDTLVNLFRTPIFFTVRTIRSNTD